MTKTEAKIFLNGCYPDEHIDFYLDEIKSGDAALIAADGGLHLFKKLMAAHPLGGSGRITPDLILGDFDSFNKNEMVPHPTGGDNRVGRKPRASDQVAIIGFENSALIEIPPENKMFTDCEFALQWCVENGIIDVIIYGGIDSAFETDHLLGNIFAMFAYKVNFQSIKMRDFCQEVIPLEDESYQGAGKPGDFISVIPVSEEVSFKAAGLKYRPDGQVFRFGSSTPLRNQLAAEKFTIELKGRAALVVHF